MRSKGHDESEPLRADVERGACVLLLTPSIHSATDDACHDLLTPTGTTDENVLWVTYSRSPDTCIRDWLSRTDERPRNARIVSVGETTRSASAAVGDSGGPDPTNDVVEPLSNPGDLTGLGIRLSEILKEWDDSGTDTVACFDSLTALLQYADLQTVYKFLHVLTGRFDTADVTAHFHLDPEACDQQTVSTLTSLFDTVVEREDDEWVVRRR
ncbi:DUF835 domain-containing protein [Halorussus gelatinilyticus]|uniref:DUF835 domain-containing protein n=1 Tax=Halorussus gelatinilyticus TaxID=2937524 RepID=A0A8U0ILF5_9EURY|nr:DUF835 domain-containing protein [Halorussus gelatinilyticus]UPW01960.1 DUF835 domain-containing protein [Halorussus gelatinilyticus]